MPSPGPAWNHHCWLACGRLRTPRCDRPARPIYRQIFRMCSDFIFSAGYGLKLSRIQFTPPTPTRRITVPSGRGVGRCELDAILTSRAPSEFVSYVNVKQINFGGISKRRQISNFRIARGTAARQWKTLS